MEVVHRRPRVLAEIDPHSEWVRGREFDTLVVDVTGWYQLRPIILAILVSRLCSNFLENRKRTKFPILFSFHWIYGAGFTKDQLKVLVEPSGSLQVSGERAVHGGGAGRQWCQFLKRFDLPAGGVDVAAIKVQLDRGMLYVQVPRPPGEEQYAAAEIHEGGALRGEEIGGQGLAEEHSSAGRLVRALSKHRHVVLNVVLAVLLWLVAFAKDKDY
jgi:hypothetical protein